MFMVKFPHFGDISQVMAGNGQFQQEPVGCFSGWHDFFKAVPVVMRGDINIYLNGC